jgi:hypothetical protein
LNEKSLLTSCFLDRHIDSIDPQRMTGHHPPDGNVQAMTLNHSNRRAIPSIAHVGRKEEWKNILRLPE